MLAITFIAPEWLFLLLLVPVIYYLYALASKKKKAAAVKFSNLAIIKQAMNKKTIWKTRLLFYLTLLSILLLVLALADLHIPLKQKHKGVNVVLAIDVSGSMQAEDYKPTRLEAAKKSAETLLKNLKTNDYAGIVIFESGATTAAYLSPIKDTVINKLRVINPKEGRTAIGDGLSLAVDMATSTPNKKNVVILLSDGVNNAGVISPQEAIGFAKTNKIKAYTIGMGSEEPVVLGYDFFGNPQYAELDEETLRNIAVQTGGEYYKSVNDETLDNIYSQLSKKIEREKEDVSIKNWFLIATLVALMVQLYVRYWHHRIIY